MSSVLLPKDTKDAALQSNSKAFLSISSPWSQSTTQKNVIEKRGKWDKYYQMYHHHSFVRAAIDKIAKTATNVGYDFVPRDSRSEVKKRDVTKLKEFFDEQGDFIYELRRVYKDLLIYGDAFMYIVPNKMRRPAKLKRLEPSSVAIRTDDHGNVIGYVQFDPNDMGRNKYVSFEAHEILHFRIDDPNNDLYGLSPLESLEWAVAADIYAQRYNAAFFQNSGISGTIVNVSGITPEEIKRNREYLKDHYTGPDAAHKPLFLEGESVSVSKAVTSHTDMGFLDGRRFILMEILAVLDVPPAKMGIMESANRSNSKEQDKSFRSESISPLQYIVESVINYQFVIPILGVKDTIFVHSEGDTRDAVELMEYYTRGIGWGVYNFNEVRGKIGLSSVDGGDINGIMTPTGFVPLDRLDLYFKIPQTNEEKVPLNEDNRDPVEGEAVPESINNLETGVSRSVAKSADFAAYSAMKAVEELARMKEFNRTNVRKSYTYLDDAKGVDPLIDEFGRLVKKSLDCDEDDMAEAYLDRAKDIFASWMGEKVNDGKF